MRKDPLFGLDRESPHDDSTELLTTVHDNVELSVLRSILDGEEIPYMIRERGSGSSVKIIAGYSMYGTDVFVPKAAAEHAREVLDAYRSAEPVNDEAGAGEEKETGNGERDDV